jgi:hypothetical protein
VIALVAITTGGRIVTRLIGMGRRDFRRVDPSPQDRAEIEALRASVDDMGDRLGRLEEERDFYRALLEAPKPADRGSSPTP